MNCSCRANFIIAVLLLAPLPSMAATSTQRPSFVEVNGHKVHVVIEGHGTPAIVLEAGSASNSASWRFVQPRLAAFSTVVSYDRAGIGRPQPGVKPRTAKQIASDLETALQAVALKPPYVLVAHSLGALYSRKFANLYPTEVAGVVLVEPAPAAFYGWFQQSAPKVWNSMLADA